MMNTEEEKSTNRIEMHLEEISNVLKMELYKNHYSLKCLEKEIMILQQIVNDIIKHEDNESENGVFARKYNSVRDFAVTCSVAISQLLNSCRKYQELNYFDIAKMTDYFSDSEESLKNSQEIEKMKKIMKDAMLNANDECKLRKTLKELNIDYESDDIL